MTIERRSVLTMLAWILQSSVQRSYASLLHPRRSLVVQGISSQEMSDPFVGSVENDLDGPTIHSTIIPHQCYILLHSFQPISEFPAKWKTPIQQALQLRASRWGGLVNFASYGPPPAATYTSGDEGSQAKKQPATVFTAAGGRLEIPDITLDNIDQVEQTLKDHLQGPLSKETGDEIHLYVCTHGARDCRCGTRGNLLVNALLEEKANYQRLYPGRFASRIKIGQVAHVGGHKLSNNVLVIIPFFHFIFLKKRYAANLLMFPHGEW